MAYDFLMTVFCSSKVWSAKIWVASWQNQQNDCVPSKDSDQPEHLPSLIRVFACVQWVAKDPSFLHADSKDSDQIGSMPRLIYLRWAQMPFCWFCSETAHFILIMGCLQCGDTTWKMFRWTVKVCEWKKRLSHWCLYLFAFQRLNHVTQYLLMGKLCQVYQCSGI